MSVRLLLSNISLLITEGFWKDLWKYGSSTAKWTILAKAYSIIRDYKGKDLAPLDVFLGITAPHIGLIAPDDYLSSLGWQFVVNDGVKRMSRYFEPEPISFSDHLRTSILSVDDILDYYCEVGYVIDNDIQDKDNSATTPRITTLTMATRPTSVQEMWTPRTYSLGLQNA